VCGFSVRTLRPTDPGVVVLDVSGLGKDSTPPWAEPSVLLSPVGVGHLSISTDGVAGVA
jgi:ribosomal protein S18 acetylase RimI-like enzyme